MADSIAAPPCPPPSIEAADRCGYRHLAAPHRGVEFKIYAYIYSDGEVLQYVEYRGAVRELVAAGIVTRKFLAPCPGRKRVDAAGRWVSLQRRPGIRVVTFKGDLFKAPYLPAVTHELVNEVIAEEKERWEESQRRFQEMKIKREEKEEQMTPEVESIHGRFCREIGALITIAQDDDATAEDLIALMPEFKAKLRARQAKRGAERKRPDFLRLVVDDGVRL